MPATRPKGQSVKSEAAVALDGAPDGHERAKDFLTEGCPLTLPMMQRRNHSAQKGASWRV